MCIVNCVLCLNLMSCKGGGGVYCQLCIVLLNLMSCKGRGGVGEVCIVNCVLYF